MSEEDRRSDADGGSDQPHFLSGLNGIIAGVTSAAVAIAALLAALTNLFGNHHAEPARAAAVAPADPAAGTGESTTSAADATSDPTHYAGTNNDGQTIEIDWDGKHWVYTDPQASYVYSDLTSSDKDMVLAYDREIDGYLRWPIAGGAVEESFKSQLEFKPVGILKPSDAD